MKNKIKGILERTTKEDFFIIALILLLGGASFGLGRLSAFEIKKESPRLYEGKELVFDSKIDTVNATQTLKVRANETLDGVVVASKNSDKYHLPWCSGANRIKEENKIWFNSRKEAEEAGFKPAGNCPGLSE